jgi:hypothetical protein
MRRGSSSRWFAILLPVAALAAAPVHAAHTGAGVCDTGIPADEPLGAVWFPRGALFCPLIADPKEDGTFASYVRGTSESAFGTDVASVGIGDQLGLFRWNGPTVGEGIQIELSGNIYAQFDLNTASYDLINADYVIGLPITWKRGAISSRVRLYHQSSHLGDEFILRGTVVRENLAFQSVEALLSGELGPLRVYGGGEYLFGATPPEVETSLVHGGVELRSRGGLLSAAGLERVRLVAGLDVKSVEDLDWAVAWSGRAGFEFGRNPESEHRSRRWSVMGEYYEGPSPYGQFFRDDVRYYGLGLHLGL